jgi:uncharacterized membrane protein
MAKILDTLLFAGPVLAVVFGLVFAFSSGRGIFARRPRQLALGMAIPILLALVGAFRLRAVESDTSVWLAVIGIAVAACIACFALAFGLGVALLTAKRMIKGQSVFRRKGGLPPGPRIRQGK